MAAGVDDHALRAAVQQQAQGDTDAFQADRLAAEVAEAVLGMDQAGGPDGGEMDQADRLLGGAAARAGDPGDRRRTRSAAERPTAPSAMARATGSDTAPWASIRSAGTPSISVLAALL